jgi:DNA-binding CsgD family transcriptional regulator/tetratricopeptide (TPR) repeat protein
VLVAGEAGIGKTRLLGELAERARRSGALVLSGRCIDLVGTGVPYLAMAESLRSLPGSPLLADLTTGPDGPRQKLRLFQQVRGALERQADGTPLVLIVEDVHWADASTLDLFSFLAHSIGQSRIMLVASYRSDEAGPDNGLPRLVGGLRRARMADAVELGPLPREELMTLLGEAAEQPVAAGVAEAICIRSGGNPFFAEELLAAAGRGEARLPRLVRAVLLQRVAGLTDSGRTVLRVASAAGRAVSYRLLAAVVPVPAGELRRALREAVEHHVLVADQAAGTFRFRHALLAEAVYGTLLPGEREDLHAALAAALDGSAETDPVGAGAGELAQHWAAAGRPVEAFAASLEAARVAESACGLAEALAHLERVLSLWDEVPAAMRLAGAPLADVLARTAEHADDTGNGGRAAELVRRAIALLDESAEPARVALLHERLGSYLLPIGDRTAGLAACHRAVDLIPPEPATPERVRVLAALGHALMLSWRFADAVSACEAAIAVAAALNDPARAFRAHDVLGLSLCYLGRPDAGLPLLFDGCRRPPERSSPERLTRPYVFLSDTLTLTGRLEEAVRVARTGLEFAREIGQEPSVGNVLSANVAEALLGIGDWRGAEQAITAALGMGGNYWSHHLHVWRAQLALGRGEFDAAREHLDAGSQATREPNAAAYHACVTADLAHWEGRFEAAADAVAQGLASAQATGAAFLTVRLCALGLRTQAELAQAATLRARGASLDEARQRAGQLLGMARRAADEAAAVTPDAAAWLALGEAEHSRIGQPDPVPWRHAAAVWEELRRPYLAGYGHWRLAEAIVASGARPSEATEPARRAYDTAVRLGAEPLRREVLLLARRARMHLTPPPAQARPNLTGRFGLTAREAEILHLLAFGYTNREIAKELTISVKTASVHVSHILRKLNVSSRVQAAAFARRLPLDSSKRAGGARAGDR